MACRRCASITFRVWVSRCSCSSVSTLFSRSASLARLDKIRMGGDQGFAPVDERFVRGEEIGDVAAFLVGHGVLDRQISVSGYESYDRILPTIYFFGTKPQWRLSELLLRWSPITK